MSQPRSAFTLIELLVVVGIIGLLAALLLPALQTVRDLAHQVRCTSNQRQIGMAVIAYAGDWNGILPPRRRRIPPYNEVAWDRDLLSEYMRGVETNFANARARGAYRCPALGMERVSWSDSSEYGLNEALFLDLNYRDTGGWDYGQERVVALASVSRTAQTYMLADASWSSVAHPGKLLGANKFGPGDLLRPGMESSGAHFRHRRRVSMVFMDMHVETIGEREFPNSSNTGMSAADLRQRTPWAARPVN